MQWLRGDLPCAWPKQAHTAHAEKIMRLRLLFCLLHIALVALLKYLAPMSTALALSTLPAADQKEEEGRRGYQRRPSRC